MNKLTKLQNRVLHKVRQTYLGEVTIGRKYIKVSLCGIPYVYINLQPDNLYDLGDVIPAKKGKLVRRTQQINNLA
jgi:hypothetical protein